MKKIFNLIGIFLTVAAIAVFFFSRVAQKATAQPSAGKQFSTFIIHTQDYWGCDPAMSAMPCLPAAHAARYFDASIGENFTQTDLAHGTSVTALTLKNGVKMRWNNRTLGYYILPPSTSTQGPITRDASNCAVSLPSGGTEAVIGTMQILGYATYEYHTGDESVPALNTPDNPYGGEKNGFEQWRAPAFGCSVLRSVSHFKGNAPTYQVATVISLVKPDASVFSPPTGAQETSPMENDKAATFSDLRKENPNITDAEEEAIYKKKLLNRKGVVDLETKWEKAHGITPSQ